MVKRGCFFLIVFVFLLVLMPYAMSIYEETLYSGTIKGGSFLDIDGAIFNFSIEPVSGKVLVSINSSGIIIPNYGCDIKGYFDICIANISFSYKNFTTFKDIYDATVKISILKSKISASNSISKNNLLMGEETNGELIAVNDADIAAKGFIARIEVPSNLLITGADGCANDYNAIILNKDITPKQIRKCAYTLKGISAGNFELTPIINYFNGKTEVNETAGTIKGKVYNYSLKVTQLLNKSRFEAGENFNIQISLKNLNDVYSIDSIALSIKLPEQFTILHKSKEFSGARILTWGGKLVPQEMKLFQIEVKSPITGNYSIISEASYKESDFFRISEERSNAEIYCNCPYIEILPQIAQSEGRKNLIASLINPSPDYEFSDIKIKYNTNIPRLQNFSAVYQKISPSQSIKFLDSLVPSPDYDSNYYLNISAVYSSTSEAFVVKDNAVIEPSQIPIQIPINKTQNSGNMQNGSQSKEAASAPSKETPNGTANKTKNAEETQHPIVDVLEGNKIIPLKVYLFGALLIVIVALTVIAIIFKKRPSKEIEVIKIEVIKKEAKKKKKSHKKSKAVKKREKASKKSMPKEEAQINKKEDNDYKTLEEEINKIGNVFEKEKEAKQSGFFGRLFRKK